MTNNKNSLRTKAVKGGRWTAISAIGTFLFQMAQLAILGRLLSPIDFGIMAVTMIVIGLAICIGDLGLGNFLVQVDKISQQSLDRLMIVALGFSLSFAGLISLIAQSLADYFSTPKLVDLLPWMSVAIVAATIGQMMFAFFQRFFQFKIIAIGEILSTFISFFTAVYVAYTGYGVWALVAGQLSMGVSKILIYIPYFLTLRRQLPVDVEVGFRLKGVEHFAVYQTGERALNYISSNLDKTILALMSGSASIGIYSVAYQIMTKPAFVINPIITRITLPIFSSIKNEDERLILGYLEVVRLIAFITFPTYIFISLGAPGIITVLMGAKWLESAPILSVLSLLGMLFSLGNPLGSLILAKGKPKYGFYLNLIALILFFIAFLIGANFGPIGIAWAFVLTTLGVLFPIEFILRKKLIGMTIASYFHGMIHLIIGALIPLSFYMAWTNFSGININQWESFLFGILGSTFFFIYEWIYDRNLIFSIREIISHNK